MQDMLIPTLSLVCLFLLTWVIVLKFEIDRLKAEYVPEEIPLPKAKDDPTTHGSTYVRGQRRYTISG